MLRLQPCCEKQRGLKRVGRRVDGSPEPVVVLGTPVYKRARGDEDDQRHFVNAKRDQFADALAVEPRVGPYRFGGSASCDRVVWLRGSLS